MGSRETDRVLIVGAGPVGLVLALVLARYRIRSLVLEARQAPTPAGESRAITWMPRGLELLAWLGLEERFKEHGLPRHAHQFRARGRRLLITPFDRLPSPFPFSLQLPQHDTEALLEQAALATGQVEIRRGWRVIDAGGGPGEAWAEVTTTRGGERLAAPWGVGCDGARSRVRHQLGVPARHRDYGAFSAVADFELPDPADPAESFVDLDPERPWGLFCFAPERWRLIYRINPGEDPQAMVTQAAATRILLDRCPAAAPRRLLWASAFRLGQGQSASYRVGRWLVAGDAAHAMGPSAGAGMMLGVLGAWRLGWRLAQVAAGAAPDGLLDDYAREQRAAAAQVQHDNARIFRNLALRSRPLGAARSLGLRMAARVPPLPERLAASEALLDLRLPVDHAADRPQSELLRPARRLGGWRSGRRLPFHPLPGGGSPLDRVRATHTCFFVGVEDADEDGRLLQALRQACPLPIDPATADRAWRAADVHGAAAALVRPDQEVVGIFRLRTRPGRSRP